MRWLLLLAFVGCTTPDDVVEDPEAISGCSTVNTVILYSEEAYDLALPGAFATVAEPCTRYYVDIPHPADDFTMPRPSADRVHALGPNFHAMAEFSWTGWHRWIDASPTTRDWTQAGQEFRARMTAAGFDVAHGDTWAINEFPSTTRTGDNDAWTHERDAVRALSADGTQGVVFVIGMGPDGLVPWLHETPWWDDMHRAVRFLAHEVYASPHNECTGEVVADAAHLDDYLERLPIVADQAGAGAEAARAYLDRAYVPLVSAAWNSDKGFGNDRVPLAAFEKFERLQVYATHEFAASHAFPGRRIGFAWSPRDGSGDDYSDLADTIARSVSRAYAPGHFARRSRDACAIDGSLDGCACDVAPAAPPATSPAAAR